MARDNSRQATHLRWRIARQAAQLMAEHGIRDHALAKKKAARQLGVEAMHGLPSNEEIDEALREYHAVFEPSFQAEDLRAMREQAWAVMRDLERFEPVLAGGLVNGAVSRHSDIELEVYLDASKEFEHFLLNEGIDFKINEGTAGSSYLLHGDPANVLIRIYPSNARHAGRKARDGRPSRLNAGQLRQLLDGENARDASCLSLDEED